MPQWFSLLAWPLGKTWLNLAYASGSFLIGWRSVPYPRRRNTLIETDNSGQERGRELNQLNLCRNRESSAQTWALCGLTLTSPERETLRFHFPSPTNQGTKQRQVISLQAFPIP